MSSRIIDQHSKVLTSCGVWPPHSRERRRWCGDAGQPRPGRRPGQPGQVPGGDEGAGERAAPVHMEALLAPVGGATAARPGGATAAVPWGGPSRPPRPLGSDHHHVPAPGQASQGVPTLQPQHRAPDVQQCLDRRAEKSCLDVVVVFISFYIVLKVICFTPCFVFVCLHWLHRCAAGKTA